MKYKLNNLEVTDVEVDGITFSYETYWNILISCFWM